MRHRSRRPAPDRLRNPRHDHGGDLMGARSVSIKTPDQRLRVFVSSTLDELAEEREAVRAAIEDLHLTPVMFELGARPHPPRDLYRAYLEQSDVFVGIYWQSYGWVAPGEDVSGIHDEYASSDGRPRLIYVKSPAPERHHRLEAMLSDLRLEGAASYKKFSTAAELKELLLDDLALLVSERFIAGAGSARSLPTGSVTFLFSDIERSTRLLYGIGDAYARLIDRHHELMRAAIAEGGGIEVATEGDSFFAVFPSAVGAVRAAASAQVALAEEPWPGGVDVRVRMGLHTGEGRLGGDSYVGLDVHRGARLAAAAHGGQTLLSGATAEMVRGALPDGATLVDLGPHRLPDIEQPERVFQLSIESLGLRFPPIRSSAERRLPVPLASLVGRDDDLRSARSVLLEPQVRLLTITGPGGIGKTRFAIELALLVEAEFPGGVRFVDLSSVVDPGLVLPAVGRALGVLDVEGREISQAIAAFVGASEILVVLDNLEQVITTGVELAAILERTTNLEFVVTSREPLRVRGEHEFPLSPLPIPDRGSPIEVLEAVPSVELFVQRARAVTPDFEMSEQNADTLAELVRRLDGVPLAIELVAPKLRFLTPAALLDRLVLGLGVFAEAPRDMPERHHNMRAAIAWSFELLSEQERKLFRRLGVFSGGWTLEAAQEVCADREFQREQVLDLLTDLVTKSMVTFYLDSGGEPRYRLLETIRRFAADELSAAGETEPAHDAHLQWCLRLVRAHEKAFEHSDFPSALDALEEERHNIRVALEWALSSQSRIGTGLEIAGLLWSYWDVRGYVTEGLGWLDRLLEGPGAGEPTEARALALDARGWLGRLHPQTSTSEAVFAEAEQLWRKTGNVRRLAWSISMHAMITFNAFQPDRAMQQFDEGARLAREAGDEQLLEIWCQFGLAHVHWMQGETEVARELLERSLAFARKWHHTWAAGHALFSLGLLDWLGGDLPAARSRQLESLALRRDMRDLRGIADCLGSIALLLATAGEHGTAAALLGAAEAQRQATGHALVPWQRPFFEQAIGTCQEALGPERFAEARAEGYRLSREQAIELALSEAPPTG